MLTVEAARVARTFGDATSVAALACELSFPRPHAAQTASTRNTGVLRISTPAIAYEVPGCGRFGVALAEAGARDRTIARIYPTFMVWDARPVRAIARRPAHAAY